MLYKTLKTKYYPVAAASDIVMKTKAHIATFCFGNKNIDSHQTAGVLIFYTPKILQARDPLPSYT